MAGGQLAAIQEHIDGIHEQIETIRKELNLHRQTESLGAIILSRCTKVWQILCDLKTARLRGYGETPPALPAYLDPRIDDILKKIDQILAAVRTIGRQ